MKTALILLSILGMACALSMKNLHRRFKLEDSEENGVFKYRPRYYLYKHGYFYPPLKQFAVQGNSDSSEENGNGDSSEEEEEEDETSNEEENNEDSNGNEDEDSEAENTTLSTITPGYGEETTPGTDYIGLAAIQLPKKAGDIGNKATKKEESDEEEEEEENENENNEAEVDGNEQAVNGTSTNSTEVENGNGSSGADNGEEGDKESVTEANTPGTTMSAGQSTGSSKTTPSPNGVFEPTTPAPEVYGSTPPPYGKTTTAEYGAEYEQTGANEYDPGYEVYDNENGGPRGDNYRAYEDEYSYYKGRGYDGYDGQDYYYHQ
ncbi:Bone sialoprotein 2 [Heterocephalus glaber]|uniref:Integrin-binding sialoprotein n=1 Tax=Heterocephalus glaber TaxID=10181 RepID=G5BSU4_HETGA|nr:bone sialoprotein 2 [Heterocephalus glaber]EHB12355.1 Bone sialoprotein 2 [Heterocephalus glaber]